MWKGNIIPARSGRYYELVGGNNEWGSVVFNSFFPVGTRTAFLRRGKTKGWLATVNGPSAPSSKERKKERKESSGRKKNIT